MLPININLSIFSVQNYSHPFPIYWIIENLRSIISNSGLSFKLTTIRRSIGSLSILMGNAILQDFLVFDFKEFFIECFLSFQIFINTIKTLPVTHFFPQYTIFSEIF